MQFSDLNLIPNILKAVEEEGYQTPSPIQQQSIPLILAGKDLMAAAQTGTGKTAGFTLPMLQRLADGSSPKANHIRALVLTPTRELAAQVFASVRKYGRYTGLTSEVVFGGVKINPQMQRLRKGVDILIATPGRLLDLYQQNAVKFNAVEFFVLDEADRMLDMGFIHDMKRISKLLPKNRQTLLFSATFSDPIKTLAKTFLRHPSEVSIGIENSAAKSVQQWLVPVDKKRKPALLLELLTKNQWQQVLVFAKTKHGSNRLVKYLQDYGVNALAIHGNKSQGARTRALAEFKQGQIQVLVATDIAARGLDIVQLPQVVNFDLPQVAEDYVHRIGRTGRAGASGQAISLVSADEIDQLNAIERLLSKTIERRLIDGFEPRHDLPQSKGDFRPPRAKKPKKPKQPRSQSTTNQSANPSKPSRANRNKKSSTQNRKSRFCRA